MFSLAIIVTPNSAQKKNAHRIQAIKQQATDQNIDLYTFIYHTTYWIFFLVSSSLSLSLLLDIAAFAALKQFATQWKTLGTKNERANYGRMMNSNEISTRQKTIDYVWCDAPLR